MCDCKCVKEKVIFKPADITPEVAGAIARALTKRKRNLGTV